MLELPEAVVIAEQMNATMVGKQIRLVIANQTPHKFAKKHIWAAAFITV